MSFILRSFYSSFSIKLLNFNTERAGSPIEGPCFDICLDQRPITEFQVHFMTNRDRLTMHNNDTAVSEDHRVCRACDRHCLHCVANSFLSVANSRTPCGEMLFVQWYQLAQWSTAFRDKLAVAHKSNKFTTFCRYRFSLPLETIFQLGHILSQMNPFHHCPISQNISPLARWIRHWTISLARSSKWNSSGEFSSVATIAPLYHWNGWNDFLFLLKIYRKPAIFFWKFLLRRIIYILCSTVARSYGSGILAANLAACVRESNWHLEWLTCGFLSTASILQLSFSVLG